MDPKELSKHLETLRQALEPLSDLSALTQSNLAGKSPGESPKEPKAGREPAKAQAPISADSSKSEYRPALSDPDLVRALLESGLTSNPLQTPSQGRSTSTDTAFARVTPEQLEVDIKADHRPLQQKRGSSILRERPRRGSP